MRSENCFRTFLVQSVLALACAVVPCALRSQLDTTARWTIAISPHGGFVVPHHKSVTHLIQGHSSGFHLYANRLTDGTKYWHEAYNAPEHGVDFTYTNTGNPEQLGQQYSTSYLLNLPLNGKRYTEGFLRISNRGFRHWVGLGMGVGYTTRRWDLENNHQAAMLGSRINIALSLQYAVRMVSFKNGELRSGIRLSHLSNGAFQLPNLGTNNAGLFVSYVVGNNRASFMKVIPAPMYHRSIFSVGIVSGLKEIPPPTGRKYAAVVISTLAERRVSYKSAFGLGIDAFYDASLRPLVLQRVGESVSAMQVMQLGAVCSYSLFFDRFALKIQQGFYVMDSFRLNGSLYHRAGLRYLIGNHLYAQLTLKTHFAKADYGELGIGYVFSK